MQLFGGSVTVVCLVWFYSVIAKCFIRKKKSIKLLSSWGQERHEL